MLTIREYEPALAPAFAAINREWIEAMFPLEDSDRAVLDDPDGAVIAKGGRILFVARDGVVVGTVALRPKGDGAVELTKMGVTSAARGSGAGRFLLTHAIGAARAMGADPLFLLSQEDCAAAIHLYEEAGFHHDAAIKARYGATYERCTVAMRYG